MPNYSSFEIQNRGIVPYSLFTLADLTKQFMFHSSPAQVKSKEAEILGLKSHILSTSAARTCEGRGDAVLSVLSCRPSSLWFDFVLQGGVWGLGGGGWGSDWSSLRPTPTQDTGT